MSILYAESFGPDLALLNAAPHVGLGFASGGSSVYQDVGRWPGSRCFAATAGGGNSFTWWRVDLQASRPTLFIGYALNIWSIGTPPTPILALVDSPGQYQAYLSVGPFLELVPAVGAPQGNYAPTGFAQIPGYKAVGDRSIYVNRWHYVEIGIHFSTSNGWIECRLDSVPTCAWYGTGTNRSNATGNTLTTTDIGVRYVYLGTAANGHCDHLYCFIQDLVIMDDVPSGISGHPNNDFLGDVGVAWLQPNGVGAHSEFVPGGSAPAATSWQSVNTASDRGNVTYTASAALGAIDTYTLADLPASASQVLAVRPNLQARKVDSGARALAPIARLASGPTEFILGPGGGAPLNIASTWSGGGISEARPDGSPWTVADINALEYGQKLVA